MLNTMCTWSRYISILLLKSAEVSISAHHDRAQTWVSECVYTCLPLPYTFALHTDSRESHVWQRVSWARLGQHTHTKKQCLEMWCMSHEGKDQLLKTSLVDIFTVVHCCPDLAILISENECGQPLSKVYVFLFNLIYPFIIHLYHIQH